MSSESHRVAFYADIFYNSDNSPAYWIPPRNLDVEVILLGGDIHYLPEQFGDMLREIRETQHDTTQIVFIPGNGEYIGQELHESRRQYRDVVDAIPNAVFLDDEVVILPSGLRILGSTLWSHVANDQIDHYSNMLADLGLHGVDDIRLGERFLTLRDTNALHRQACAFLAGQLQALSPAERDKTIVCTHFWPTLRPWIASPDSDEGKWLHMVGSDLDEFIAERGPKYWLCGHAHVTRNLTIGATRISSNPRAGDGPGHVNPDFDENYLVTI